MVIHKCDICEKELYGTWLTIRVDIDAKLIPNQRKVEVCESCYNELKYDFVNLKRKKR
jgi:hypothetical protein